MTNVDTTHNIQINWTEIEKVTNNKYLGQPISMENKTKEVSTRIKARGSFWKVQRNLFGQAPSNERKKKVF